jgi:L-iditol 2-dehydrogenase
MKVARYFGAGELRIVDEPIPECPEGGLLVKTLACGLCSGELMDWYMDTKIPHVIGHEVCGVVVETRIDRYQVGERVFPHHHAPCMSCEFCQRGHYVHCPQWKRTKLVPGGMSEYFAVNAENLNDTLSVGDLDPRDAAIIEPVACVVKSLSAGRDLYTIENPLYICNPAVIGLGTFGLMHLMLLAPNAVGIDTNPARVEHAISLGLTAVTQTTEQFDLVFVCPGSADAFELAVSLVRPQGRIVCFAPVPPGTHVPFDFHAAYFRDLQISFSYSCSLGDTMGAYKHIESGRITHEKIIDCFVTLDELPIAYLDMKAGRIMKAMVVFDP